MRLRQWEELPAFMQCDEIKEYYDILAGKTVELRLKRLFDVLLSGILLLFLAVPMIIIAVLIKRDSKGPVFFRQERITSYGRRFRIHKFRTMVNHADKIGSAVTVDKDTRITKVGSKLRDLRLDELPQLIDVLFGNMSFVGTRPEAVKYVKQYTKEMNATLLLPAGITSEASIRYKDEAALLNRAEDVDKVYVETILPEKMTYNLRSIKAFSLCGDAMTMLRTVFAVVGRNNAKK